MVWLLFILIWLIVSFIAVWFWQPRLDAEEKSIAWGLWQLPLWFAAGAVPTYLLGVICSTLKGYGGWSSGEAIGGGFLTGFGVMAYIAAPLVDIAALGVPRRRVLVFRLRYAGALLLVAFGLGIATVPLWMPDRLAPLVTPEARRGLVKALQNPDESIRRQAADLLFDFGTPDEIPALEMALKKAQQSGDRELEQKCNRALQRIRRR